MSARHEDVRGHEVGHTGVADPLPLPERLAAVWRSGVTYPAPAGGTPTRWRVRRAWPADLDNAEAGYVLECEPDGRHQLTAGADRLPVVLDHEGLKVVSAEGGGDPRLPALATWRARGGNVVSHRPLKRAVLRMPDGTFVKLARTTATRRALERAAQVETVLEGAADASGPRPPLRPTVLDSDASEGMIRLAPAAGVSLADLLVGLSDQSDQPQNTAAHRASIAEPVLGTVATALVEALLATGRVRPGSGTAAQRDTPGARGEETAEGGATLPVHTLADEADVLLRWVRAAAAGAPAAGLPQGGAELLLREAEHTAEALRRAHAAGSAARTERVGALALTHRDLHAGQIICAGVDKAGDRTGAGADRGAEGVRVTVLDWDTASWAHPGVDVANLLAHLDREHARTGHEVYPRLADAIESGLREHGHSALATGEAGDTLALLRRATRLRITAVHAFRPGPVDQQAFTAPGGSPSRAR